jgi:hypothetical protein
VKYTGFGGGAIVREDMSCARGNPLRTGLSLSGADSSVQSAVLPTRGRGACPGRLARRAYSGPSERLQCQ